MRPRTLVGLALVLGFLIAGALYGLSGTGGGSLSEAWVSDTARENEVNHHPVAAQGDLIVAPVAAVVNVEEIGPNSCVLARLAPETGSVRWRAGVRPVNCTTHALTEPLLADLDGDGEMEVAAASTENAVVVHAAETGAEEYRIPLGTYGYGRPTAGNLTDAPGPELVASDIVGGVVAAAGETVLWRDAANGTTWAAPVVADVDADGETEVVVGTAEEVVTLTADGTREWRATVSATRLAAADADEDQAVELFTTTTRTVRSLDGRNGTVAWTTHVEGSPALHEVGDGDGDGTPEVYVGVSGGRVVALDAATGAIEWRTQLVPERRATMPPPTLGDVDGDGAPELVAAANDGTVAVLDPVDGRELASYRREVPIWTEPTVEDVDGDGRAEILVRYGDGRVAMLTYGS